MSWRKVSRSCLQPEARNAKSASKAAYGFWATASSIDQKNNYGGIE
jgi:hypothetical protein